MRLNAFLWQNFLESSKGREWIDFFSGLRGLYDEKSESLKRFINRWTSQGLLDIGFTADTEINDVLDALEVLEVAIEDKILPSTIADWDEASLLYREIIYNLVSQDTSEEEIPIFSVDDVPRLSVALYCLYPKFFFPYYFFPRFYALRKIFDEFGIFLSPIPAKKDIGARFLYYLDLCYSLRNYWLNLEFEPEHIPAFLYGFCPEVIDLEYCSVSELPKPQRAWFVGGGINNNGDFEYLDQATSSSQTFWQGNIETEVGDIVVMYCLSPRSYIHSIWRAVQPGSIEPFRFFYSTIWIGYPQRVAPIALREMRSDPVLSEMPLVKSNMQGINGRQIPKRFYDRILTLLEAKGMKVESLPQLPDIHFGTSILRNERDVELHLLEPLLHELGFTAEDWERQVILQVGRQGRVVPDYLIFPSRNPLSQNIRAAWVWEAKFSITSNNQLQMDFEQATSYARLVDAYGVGLVSKEGLWLSLRIDSYSLHKSRHWSWWQLREIDYLNELRDIAGKRQLHKNG